MVIKLNQKTDVVIVVDLQNDFCPGGALAVPDGDKILPVVNNLTKKFDYVVATMDWHPENHCSFLAQGGQWPKHCVEGTWGALLHPDFDIDRIRYFLVVFKGFMQDRDDYSGFAARNASIELPLGILLREKWGKFRIFVVGLATDYCVKATVLDGLKLGFEVYVVTDAIAAVNVNPGDGERALQEMEDAGAQLCTSGDIISS